MLVEKLMEVAMVEVEKEVDGKLVYVVSVSSLSSRCNYEPQRGETLCLLPLVRLCSRPQVGSDQTPPGSLVPYVERSV